MASDLGRPTQADDHFLGSPAPCGGAECSSQAELDGGGDAPSGLSGAGTRGTWGPRDGLRWSIHQLMVYPCPVDTIPFLLGWTTILFGGATKIATIHRINDINDICYIYIHDKWCMICVYIIIYIYVYIYDMSYMSWYMIKHDTWYFMVWDLTTYIANSIWLYGF
jgi:hypothetical protein